MYSWKDKIPHIALSKANPDPMYKQVMDQIRDAITTGLLVPETRLPSIRELAGELGTSPITVRRAYGDLESAGFIVTRAGLGSYVAGLDRERLREAKAREIRDELDRIVRTAEVFGIPREEIRSMINETKEGIDDSV